MDSAPMLALDWALMSERTNLGRTDFWIVAQAAELYRLSPVEPSEALTAVSAWVHLAQAEAVRNGAVVDSRYRGFALPQDEYWQNPPTGHFRGPPPLPLEPPLPHEERPYTQPTGETGVYIKLPSETTWTWSPDPPPPPKRTKTMKCCPISIDMSVKRAPEDRDGRKCALWTIKVTVRVRESDECSSSCCTIKYMAGGRITRKKKGGDEMTEDLGALRAQRHSPYRIATFRDPAATSDPFLLFKDPEVGYLTEDIGIGVLPTGGKLPDGTTEYARKPGPIGLTTHWVENLQAVAAAEELTRELKSDLAEIVRALQEGDLAFLQGRAVHSGDENSYDTEVGAEVAGERPIAITANPGVCADPDETITLTRKYTVMVYPKSNAECSGGGRMQRALRLSVTFHGADSLAEIKNKQKQKKGPKIRGTPK